MAMLIPILKLSSTPYSDRVEIITAILRLQQDQGISNMDAAQKAVLSILLSPNKPPTCLNTVEKAFISASIELLMSAGIHDREFYVALLICFLDGEREVR